MRALFSRVVWPCHRVVFRRASVRHRAARRGAAGTRTPAARPRPGTAPAPAGGSKWDECGGTAQAASPPDQKGKLGPARRPSLPDDPHAGGQGATLTPPRHERDGPRGAGRSRREVNHAKKPSRAHRSRFAGSRAIGPRRAALTPPGPWRAARGRTGTMAHRGRRRGAGRAAARPKEAIPAGAQGASPAASTETPPRRPSFRRAVKEESGPPAALTPPGESVLFGWNGKWMPCRPNAEEDEWHGIQVARGGIAPPTRALGERRSVC